MARFIAVLLSFSLIFQPVAAYAQYIPGLNLPAPGAVVNPSPAFVPVLIKGLSIDPENPFQFEFIVDSGNARLTTSEIKQESERLVKYFLASMTVPEGDLWVNLSPYEQNRIVPEELGKTDLGRDMLAQDYLLKQLTASMIDPQKELGKKFWERVRKLAQQKYGTTDIPMNSFNKVWILPSAATVFEKGTAAYVVESRLKVMLEEDYLALQKSPEHQDTMSPATTGDLVTGDVVTSKVSTLSSQIIKELIIPEVEKEVNTGRNFAPLRQIYNSLILAKWYKETIKETLLAKVYVDKNKIAGVDLTDKTIKDKIYAQYVAAYKKGVFSYIKEDYDAASEETIPRKYFSGGLKWQFGLNRTQDSAMLSGQQVGNNFRLTVEAQAQQAQPPIVAERRQFPSAPNPALAGQDHAMMSGDDYKFTRAPYANSFKPTFARRGLSLAAQALLLGICVGCGQDPAEDKLEKLIKSLESENQQDRVPALKELESMGPAAKSAVPTLVKLVARLQAKVKIAHAQKKESYSKQYPATVKATPDQEAKIKSAIKTFDTSEDLSERQKALDAISEISQAAVPFLIAELTNPKQYSRFAASATLGYIGPAAHEAVLPLIRCLENEKGDSFVRGSVAQTLGKIGPAAITPLLKVLRENSDPVVVLHAIVALGEMPLGPRTTEIEATLKRLLNQLGQGNDLVTTRFKEEISAALRKLPFEVFTDYPEYAELLEVLRILEKIGPAAQEAVPVLTTLLAEGAPVNYLAASALGAIGPAAKSAVPQLIKIIDYHISDARYFIVNALGQIGDPSALPAVRLMLNDADKDVREAAQQAIKALKDKDRAMMTYIPGQGIQRPQEGWDNIGFWAYNNFEYGHVEYGQPELFVQKNRNGVWELKYDRWLEGQGRTITQEYRDAIHALFNDEARRSQWTSEQLYAEIVKIRPKAEDALAKDGIFNRAKEAVDKLNSVELGLRDRILSSVFTDFAENIYESEVLGAKPPRSINLESLKKNWLKYGLPIDDLKSFLGEVAEKKHYIHVAGSINSLAVDLEVFGRQLLGSLGKDGKVTFVVKEERFGPDATQSDVERLLAEKFGDLKSDPRFRVITSGSTILGTNFNTVSADFQMALDEVEVGDAVLGLKGENNNFTAEKIDYDHYRFFLSEQIETRRRTGIFWDKDGQEAPTPVVMWVPAGIAMTDRWAKTIFTSQMYAARQHEDRKYSGESYQQRSARYAVIRQRIDSNGSDLVEELYPEALLLPLRYEGLGKEYSDARQVDPKLTFIKFVRRKRLELFNKASASQVGSDRFLGSIYSLQGNGTDPDQVVLDKGADKLEHNFIVTGAVLDPAEWKLSALRAKEVSRADGQEGQRDLLSHDYVFGTFPKAGLSFNGLYFFTPTLREIYNRYRADRKDEQLSEDEVNFYLDAYQTNDGFENIPLYNKGYFGMKDGKLVFGRRQLQGGQMTFSIDGIEKVVAWTDAQVSTDVQSPAAENGVIVYTPMQGESILISGKSDRDNDYHPSVGADRINLVVINNQIKVVKDGEVILPSIGVVISLSKDKYAEIFGSLDAGQVKNKIAGSQFKFDWPKAGESRPDWYLGGGTLLVSNGDNLVKNKSTAYTEFKKEGWFNRLSMQTQETQVQDWVRGPRMILGNTTDGEIFAFALSGRSPGVTAGANFAEAIEIVQRELKGKKILNAINLDGGSSVSLNVRGADGKIYTPSWPATGPDNIQGISRPVSSLVYFEKRDTPDRAMTGDSFAWKEGMKVRHKESFTKGRIDRITQRNGKPIIIVVFNDTLMTKTGAFRSNVQVFSREEADRDLEPIEQPDHAMLTTQVKTVIQIPDDLIELQAEALINLALENTDMTIALAKRKEHVQVSLSDREKLNSFLVKNKGQEIQVEVNTMPPVQGAGPLNVEEVRGVAKKLSDTAARIQHTIERAVLYVHQGLAAWDPSGRDIGDELRSFNVLQTVHLNNSRIFDPAIFGEAEEIIDALLVLAKSFNGEIEYVRMPGHVTIREAERDALIRKMRGLAAGGSSYQGLVVRGRTALESAKMTNHIVAMIQQFSRQQPDRAMMSGNVEWRIGMDVRHIETQVAGKVVSVGTRFSPSVVVEFTAPVFNKFGVIATGVDNQSKSTIHRYELSEVDDFIEPATRNQPVDHAMLGAEDYVPMVFAWQAPEPGVLEQLIEWAKNNPGSAKLILISGVVILGVFSRIAQRSENWDSNTIEGNINRLKSKNLDERREAENALEKLGATKGQFISGYLAALKISDDEVKSAAADALLRLGYSEAIEAKAAILNKITGYTGGIEGRHIEEVMELLASNRDFEVDYEPSRTFVEPPVYTGLFESAYPGEENYIPAQLRIYSRGKSIRKDRVDQAMLSGLTPGGIDMNKIDVNKQGQGAEINFNDAQMQNLLNGNFGGFAPVIINIVPIPSILPILGLKPEKEDEIKVSSAK